VPGIKAKGIQRSASSTGISASEKQLPGAAWSPFLNAFGTSVSAPASPAGELADDEAGIARGASPTRTFRD
jgi:hypothetical protein